MPISSRKWTMRGFWSLYLGKLSISANCTRTFLPKTSSRFTSRWRDTRGGGTPKKGYMSNIGSRLLSCSMAFLKERIVENIENFEITDYYKEITAIMFTIWQYITLVSSITSIGLLLCALHWHYHYSWSLYFKPAYRRAPSQLLRWISYHFARFTHIYLCQWRKQSHWLSATLIGTSCQQTPCRT